MLVFAGLHIGHDANASLFIDGALAITVEAERVTGQKHAVGIDAALVALRAALDFCGLTVSDIQSACIADELTPPLSLERNFPPLLARTHAPPFLCEVFPAEGTFDGAIGRLKLELEDAAIFACCHGVAHAASALYMAGFSDSTIFVYDGYGSCGASMALSYSDQGLTVDSPSVNRLQVGLKYAQFGYFFEGIRKTAPSRGGGMAFIAEFVDFAGKIMGAQAYGSAKPKMVADLAEWFALNDEDIYLATVHTRDEGAPAIAGLDPGNLYNSLHADCLKLADQVSFDMIAAMQDAFTLVAERQIAGIHGAGTSRNLILAGGCALNILTNERLARIAGLDALFIPPHCDDRGLSAGAAALLHAAMTDTKLHFPDVPLGRRRSPFQGLPLLEDAPAPPPGIVRAAAATGAEYERLVDLLMDGRTVGLVQGRAEVGPRALGNRSLLAPATDAGIKDRINQTIKHREWWRPFAPVVRAMDADRVFEMPRHDSYMLTGGLVRPHYRPLLPAITHVDGTARVQCLPDRAANPMLWDILTELHHRTGLGVLLNTSFNVGGKPLVSRASEALSFLADTGLDALWMEGALYLKEAGPDMAQRTGPAPDKRETAQPDTY